MTRLDTIVDVPGIKVGHAQDKDALTGCTVILCGSGAVAGVDVRGSAPGTRETDLLDPVNLVNQVHAICLSGGSAYGLDAASGVMRYLEEQGSGLFVGVGIVPIVPAAVLFDLAIGSSSIRPDASMGYKAAQNASCEPVAIGNVGAGCGATVGKLAGFEHAMKSGLGSASVTLQSGVTVGAIVAVNAVGEVRDPKTGIVLAGARSEDGTLLDSLLLLQNEQMQFLKPGTNTTIGVIATNAKLTKAEANKVAQMAHDGLARTLFPVHTMHDGDTLFALSTGDINASVTMIGTLAADVLEKAVVRAVKEAAGAGGLLAYQDIYQ